MSKNKKKSNDTFRGCLMCSFGHFTDNLPLQGECRFNPPRPIFDKNGSTSGRTFVPVRFDDWCGRLIPKKSESINTQFEKIRPYLAPEQMLVEAKRSLNESDIDLALKLFEPLFQDRKLDADVVYKISDKIYKRMREADDGERHVQQFVSWQKRAADLDHPAACYSYALTLVQEEFSILDEELSKSYLEKAANLGNSTAQQRLADQRYFQVTQEASA